MDAYAQEKMTNTIQHRGPKGMVAGFSMNELNFRQQMARIGEKVNGIKGPWDIPPKDPENWEGILSRRWTSAIDKF